MVPDRSTPLLRSSDCEASAPASVTTLGTQRDGSTLAQSIFNVLNVYVGMALLSMPFAMALSGWIGVVAIACTTLLFAASAMLLISAFDCLPAGTPHTYAELGKAALGRHGRTVTLVLTLVEFFGGSCIIIVVIWQELLVLLPSTGLFRQSQLHSAVMLATLAMLPSLFIPTFRRLSCLSMLGAVCNVLVCAAILSAPALDNQRTLMPIQPPPGHTAVTGWRAAQGVGIFALSVSAHSSLPVLRASMARPQQFQVTLRVAFGAMLVLYVACAAAGYYYWGDAASPIVTADLATDSVFSGRSWLLPGLTVDRITAAFILAKAYTTYPLVALCLQETVVGMLPLPAADGCEPPPVRGLLKYSIRVAVLLLGVTIAFLAFDELGVVFSLVGGCASMGCSVIMPTVFYFCLYQKELSMARKSIIMAMLGIGCVLVILITTVNGIAVVHHSPSASSQSDSLNHWSLLGLRSLLIAKDKIP